MKIEDNKGYFVELVDLNYSKDKEQYLNAVQMFDGEGKEFFKLSDAQTNKPAALNVVIEATHDGKNKNYVDYLADNMIASAYTWTTPYPKPVLKNHNDYGDPLGRVIKAVGGDSITHPGSKALFLTLNITDKDAIDKFLDGRYSTVSISGTAKSIHCSICGTNILSDKWCRHWKGEKYSVKKDSSSVEGTDEICYWVIGDMEYSEVSVVNKPADFKQTGPINIVKLDDKGNPIQEETKPSSDSTSEEDELNDFTDALLGKTSIKDNDNSKDNSDDKQPEQTPVAKTSDDLEKVEQMQTQIDTLTDEKKALDKELNDAKIKLEALELQVSTLTDSAAKLTKLNQNLEKSMEDKTNQNLILAKELKDTYAKAVCTLDKAKTFDSLKAVSLLKLKDSFNSTITTMEDEKHNPSEKGTVADDIEKAKSPGFDNREKDNTDTNSDKNQNKDENLQDESFFSIVNKMI